MADRGEVALEVDPDHIVPVGLVGVEGHLVAHDPGVVDQDVEAAEGLDGLIDDVLGALPRADVVAVDGGLAPVLLDEGDDLFGRVLVVAPRRPATPPTSLTTTLAPSPASKSASSRPMPRPAPVTIATLPSSSPMVISFCCGQAQLGRCGPSGARPPEDLAGDLGDQVSGLAPGPGGAEAVRQADDLQPGREGSAAAPGRRRPRYRAPGSARRRAPARRRDLAREGGRSRWPSPVTTRSAACEAGRQPGHGRPPGRNRARDAAPGRRGPRPGPRPPPRRGWCRRRRRSPAGSGRPGSGGGRSSRATCSGDAPFCGPNTAAASTKRVVTSHATSQLDAGQAAGVPTTWTAPQPPSVVAEPPQPMTIRVAPASRARRRRWPTPAVSAATGSSPRGWGSSARGPRPGTSRSPPSGHRCRRPAAAATRPRWDTPSGPGTAGVLRRPADGEEEAFTAVGHRDLVGGPAGPPRRAAHRGGDLRGGGGTPEFVGRGDQVRHGR